MKRFFRGSIAREILFTYIGLATIVVLVSGGTIVAAKYVQQTLLVEARKRQELALLSARIRSMPCSLLMPHSNTPFRQPTDRRNSRYSTIKLLFWKTCSDKPWKM